MVMISAWWMRRSMRAMALPARRRLLHAPARPVGQDRVARDRRLGPRAAHHARAPRSARGPRGSHRTCVDLITSQLPVNAWHDVIGEPTLADAICDRLIHTAHVMPGVDGKLTGDEVDARSVRSSRTSSRS